MISSNGIEKCLFIIIIIILFASFAFIISLSHLHAHSSLFLTFSIFLTRNALDAGAENVSVSLEGTGLKKITVLDDGHGMTLEGAYFP